MLPEGLSARLEGLEREYADCEARLADPDVVGDQARYVEMTRRCRELRPIVEHAELLASLGGDLAAARELGRSASARKVEIKPLQRFWPAEEYHQNYAERNGLKYKYYRWSCGRDRRLDAVWGKRARSAAAWGSR